MTQMEERGLLKGSALLLALALGRFLLTGQQDPVVAPGEEEDGLPVLLEAARESREREARRRQPLGPGEKLDPNRSPEEELDRLPGVGPAVAEAIIRSRVEQGGFRGPEALLEVPGIGPVTLERIRPHLDFSRGLPPDLQPDEPLQKRIDVNQAGTEELRTLPGIGPALAQRIIDSRAGDGPFASVEDLLRVRGIGPKTLARLRPLVRVGR